MSKSPLEIVPYSRKHLDSLRPGSHDAATAFQLRYEQGWDGKAATALLDGRAVGLCGIAVTEGVAHVWLVLSDEIRGRPFEISRMAKATFEYLKARPDVSAIEAEVEPEFAAARRWAEWVGFKPEGERKMVWQQ